MLIVGAVLSTVTFTGADVVVTFWLSVATAVMLYEPGTTGIQLRCRAHSSPCQ